MRFDRRALFLAGGSLLVGCETTRHGADGARRGKALDRLLEAHAERLPERPGAGANHYPMAAEVLAELGREDAIEAAWVDAGAALYPGPAPRVAPLQDERDVDDALGRYERFGDWLDLFRASLRREPWRAVVARWAPRLAPALTAAAFHGPIRTGHAVRALRRRDTAPRRNELAVGLAYWAARHVVLPTSADAREGASLRETLAALEHPWIDDRADVEFFSVVDRLVARPCTPPVRPADRPARAELDAVVAEAAASFLEMLVLERNRLWLLHTVTGPAAVEWLLPEVDEASGRALVAHARQAVVAMHFAYGEPHEPRTHVRAEPAAWPELVERVVASRSVHGIKLVDALLRFDRDDNPLWRSVAEQWLEWT